MVGSSCSERILKAVFQLSSINCVNSFLEILLSPSTSYARKVSEIKYTPYIKSRCSCHWWPALCPSWITPQKCNHFCPTINHKHRYLIKEDEQPICKRSVPEALEVESLKDCQCLVELVLCQKPICRAVSECVLDVTDDLILSLEWARLLVRVWVNRWKVLIVFVACCPPILYWRVLIYLSL